MGLGSCVRYTESHKLYVALKQVTLEWFSKNICHIFAAIYVLDEQPLLVLVFPGFQVSNLNGLGGL